MLRLGIAMFGDLHFFARGLRARRFFPPHVTHALALGQKERDAALRRLRHAFDQRPIDFLRLARAENLAELGRHAARLGDKEHTGRIAIEPMDEHRTLALFIRERSQHAIDMMLGA